MQFLGACFYPELPPKLVVQRLGVVTHHIQAATLGGAFRSESTDDYVAARPHGFQHGFDVRLALPGIDEKVEYCAIVPDVKRLERE